MSKMHISIVLATYKRTEVLSRTLNGFCALNAKGIDWEVLVVDNAGDKRTQEVVVQYQERIPVQYFVQAEPGKSKAQNSILPLAKGEVIIFTDDDVIADPQWLKEIWEGIRRWPQYFIFGGKILPERPEIIPDEFKRLKKYILDYAVADWPIAEGPCSPYEVFGPNFAIRRELLEYGWRLNPDMGVGTIFPSGEETDFVLRLQGAGFTPVYLPKAVVYHQIRPEQTTLKWLYQRAFNSGRARVYTDREESTEKIGGIPRYLYRQLITSGVQYFSSFLGTDKVMNIENGKNFWNIRGQMYQYRMLNGKPN